MRSRRAALRASRRSYVVYDLMRSFADMDNASSGLQKRVAGLTRQGKAMFRPRQGCGEESKRNSARKLRISERYGDGKESSELGQCSAAYLRSILDILLIDATSVRNPALHNPLSVFSAFCHAFTILDLYKLGVLAFSSAPLSFPFLVPVCIVLIVITVHQLLPSAKGNFLSAIRLVGQLAKGLLTR